MEMHLYIAFTIVWLAGVKSLSIQRLSGGPALWSDIPSPEALQVHRRDNTPVNLTSIPTEQCNIPDGVLKPYCHLQPPLFADCPLIACEDGDPDSNCQTYTRECFCSQSSPLICAWSCDWRGWMYVEDWFSQTCPEVPQVDFSPLPSCARSCVESNSLNYGCIAQSRNCFCLEGNLFNCTDHCKKQSEIESIAHWFSDLCSSSLDSVFKDNGSFLYNITLSGHKQAIVIPPPTPNHLKWYEILVIVTAVLTAFVGCAWVLARYLFQRAWRWGQRQRLEDDRQEAEDKAAKGANDGRQLAEEEHRRKSSGLQPDRTNDRAKQDDGGGDEKGGREGNSSRTWRIGPWRRDQKLDVDMTTPKEDEAGGRGPLDEKDTTAAEMRDNAVEGADILPTPLSANHSQSPSPPKQPPQVHETETLLSSTSSPNGKPSPPSSSSNHKRTLRNWWKNFTARYFNISTSLNTSTREHSIV